jgi:hypothetical protein
MTRSKLAAGEAPRAAKLHVAGSLQNPDRELLALGHGHGRDDECRVRTDNAPANFATCRHIAYNLTRKPRARIPSVFGAKPREGTTSISPASSPPDGLHPIPLHGAASDPCGREQFATTKFKVEFAVLCGHRAEVLNGGWHSVSQFDDSSATRLRAIANSSARSVLKARRG